MSGPPENTSRSLSQRLIAVVVLPLLILDEIARPLYGPLLRAIARLRFLKAITALIIRLPPYAILCILAVPFIIAEPLKVVALYWIGTGHFLVGAATLVAAYALSFVLVERIYDAGREKLGTIAWFARALTWVSGYRDALLAWLRTTGAWRMARSALMSARTRIRGLFHLRTR